MELAAFPVDQPQVLLQHAGVVQTVGKEGEVDPGHGEIAVALLLARDRQGLAVLPCLDGVVGGANLQQAVAHLARDPMLPGVAVGFHPQVKAPRLGADVELGGAVAVELAAVEGDRPVHDRQPLHGVAGRRGMLRQDGDRVHVSSYASVKKEAARSVAQVVLSVKDCLETWLGVPYPFQDLQVIEVQQWGWGQAPPGLIFITQEAFLTRASSRIDSATELGAATTARGINERVAHEVAHGWFPHVAKVVRPEENWLSESLADYTSAVCLAQRMANKREGKQRFERQLRKWKILSKEAGDAASVYLAHHLSGDADDWRIRRALLYGRGPLVLHAIRQELNRQQGEEKGGRLFFAWIRSYVKNFTFKTAETRHLIAILNQITGQDWQPFFERHIYGTETPRAD